MVARAVIGLVCTSALTIPVVMAGRRGPAGDSAVTGIVAPPEPGLVAGAEPPPAETPVTDTSSAGTPSGGTSPATEATAPGPPLPAPAITSPHTASRATTTTRVVTTRPPARSGPAPVPAPAPGSIRAAPLAPASGVWFGYYAQTAVYSQQAAQAAMTNLETATGRTAGIDHWYEPWGDKFPTWRQPWDFAGGRIPMISWGKRKADAILSGADDAYIAARADGIKALGKPLFLRWFWEMDFSDNLAYSQSPQAYVAAWRHIHAIFTARGVTNVAWVWCPNASSFKTGSAQRYYPGDDVVDWICADGYNFAPDSPYREFEPIFAGFYAWASQRPKPLMIGEYGDQKAGPGQRAAWLDAAHTALVKKFPRILAVVYFHSDSEHDWTLSDEPDALAAFRRMALDPYFNPPPIYPRR
jgi:hypothetical protein